MSEQSIESPEKNLKLPEKNVKYLKYFKQLDTIEPYFESSFETSMTEDDSIISRPRINLKLIKENVKRKASFQIPDIHALNLDTRNSSCQTELQEDQLVKVISQFRFEKEKFQDYYTKEKENNAQLLKTLDDFKEKTRELENSYFLLNQKLESSLNSENVHVKQSQELSIKCVDYSNQLITVNQRINELIQELNGSRDIIQNHKDALVLFSVKNGDIKELILQEREEKDQEIKKLNERMENMIQSCQKESSSIPNLVPEDKLLIGKLQDKIVFLKEEAEKEKRDCQNILLNNENMKQEVEMLVLYKKFNLIRRRNHCLIKGN